MGPSTTPTLPLPAPVNITAASEADPEATKLMPAIFPNSRALPTLSCSPPTPRAGREVSEIAQHDRQHAKCRRSDTTPCASHPSLQEVSRSTNVHGTPDDPRQNMHLLVAAQSALPRTLTPPQGYLEEIISVDQKTQSNKRRHGRKKGPGHVRRPPNAFILFRSWLFKVEHKVLATRGMPKIGLVASTLWYQLLPEERKQWHDLADLNREHHREMNPDYCYQPERSAPRRKATKTDEDASGTAGSTNTHCDSAHRTNKPGGRAPLRESAHQEILHVANKFLKQCGRGSVDESKVTAGRSESRRLRTARIHGRASVVARLEAQHRAREEKRKQKEAPPESQCVSARDGGLQDQDVFSAPVLATNMFANCGHPLPPPSQACSSDMREWTEEPVSPTNGRSLAQQQPLISSSTTSCYMPAQPICQSLMSASSNDLSQDAAAAPSNAEHSALTALLMSKASPAVSSPGDASDTMLCQPELSPQPLSKPVSKPDAPITSPSTPVLLPKMSLPGAVLPAACQPARGVVMTVEQMSQFLLSAAGQQCAVEQPNDLASLFSDMMMPNHRAGPPRAPAQAGTMASPRDLLGQWRRQSLGQPVELEQWGNPEVRAVSGQVWNETVAAATGSSTTAAAAAIPQAQEFEHSVAPVSIPLSDSHFLASNMPPSTEWKGSGPHQAGGLPHGCNPSRRYGISQGTYMAGWTTSLGVEKSSIPSALPGQRGSTARLPHCDGGPNDLSSGQAATGHPVSDLSNDGLQLFYTAGADYGSWTGMCTAPGPALRADEGRTMTGQRRTYSQAFMDEAFRLALAASTDN